jgi:hypothetical protein
MFSVFHPSENEQTSSIMVWFLPVPDNSLSSHWYYVIRAKGRHKGYECVGKYYYMSKQWVWSINVWGSIIVVSECIRTFKIIITMSLSCDSNFMDQTKKRNTNLRTELNSKSHIQGCFLNFDTLVSDTAWHIQEFKLVGLNSSMFIYTFTCHCLSMRDFIVFQLYGTIIDLILVTLFCAIPVCYYFQVSTSYAKHKQKS